MKPKRSSQIVINCILGVLAVVWIFPIFFALLASFKGRQEYNLGNFWDFPQSNQLMSNIRYIQDNASALTSMLNTLIYAALGAFFAVLIALLAAYAISHLEIKFRMFWFMFIYSGTVFPFQIYLIPIYRGYSKVGLYDTRFGMVLFYTAICIPFAMFVLRNFFLGVSKEVIESARIDGASNFQALMHILAPMAKAPLAVVLVQQFSFCWNDLMFGMTFTKSDSTRNIMTTLSLMGQRHVPALMLACLLASIPTMVIFIFFQEEFESGFVYTSK